MQKQWQRVDFEDYGFKYFHEGLVYVQEIVTVWTHGGTCTKTFVQSYEVSVRELERMMFGC